MEYKAVEKIVAETRAQYLPVDRDTATVYVANVGDRLVFMAMSGDEDVLEVLLTRKKSVVARALTDCNGFEVGKKYDMPLEYSMFPPMAQGGQVSLYRKPTVEKVKKAGAVRIALEGGVTKIQRCRELYAANVQLSREEMVALFVKEANCTPQGAVTYFITCKKG